MEQYEQYPIEAVPTVPTAPTTQSVPTVPAVPVSTYPPIEPSFIPKAAHIPEYVLLIGAGLIINNLLKPLFGQIVLNFQKSSEANDRAVKAQKHTIERLDVVIKELQHEKDLKTEALFTTHKHMEDIAKQMERQSDTLRRLEATLATYPNPRR